MGEYSKNQVRVIMAIYAVLLFPFTVLELTGLFLAYIGTSAKDYVNNKIKIW